MFFHRRRPGLLLFFLALLGFGCMARRCRSEGGDTAACRSRRMRARHKFREGLEILFAEDEAAPDAPAAGDGAGL